MPGDGVAVGSVFAVAAVADDDDALSLNVGFTLRCRAVADIGLA